MTAVLIVVLLASYAAALFSDHRTRRTVKASAARAEYAAEVALEAARVAKHAANIAARWHG